MGGFTLNARWLPKKITKRGRSDATQKHHRMFSGSPHIELRTFKQITVKKKKKKTRPSNLKHIHFYISDTVPLPTTLQGQ
jgi:hypothetical protein